MKRLIALICLLALVIPGTSFAEYERLQDIGPYTFDTLESSAIERYSDTQLYIQYPDDQSQLTGLYIEYIAYEELSTSYSGIMDMFAADDPWTLAYLLLDNWYSYDNSDGAYLGYETEDISPYLSPAAALFHCPTTTGYMSGALFVTEDGLLFVHLAVNDTSISEATQQRNELLARLSFCGDPVVRDTKDENAPTSLPVDTSGDAVTITLGSFNIPIRDYLVMDASDGDSVYLDYPDRYVNIAYFSPETVELIIMNMDEAPTADSGDRGIAEGFYYYLYEELGIGQGAYTSMQVDNAAPRMPLLFSGRLTADYGSGYGAGAVLMDSGGMLVIEVISINNSYSRAGISDLRDDLIAGIYFTGSSPVDSIYIEGRHAGHLLSSKKLLSLGRAFAFDTTGSISAEEQPDAATYASGAAYPAYYVYYEEGRMYLYYEPYELYGTSRERLLATVSQDSSETALIQYIGNVFRYGSVANIAESFTVESYGEFGEHAWLRFSFEEYRGDELTTTCGVIITQESGILIAFLRPDEGGISANDSRAIFDGYFEHMRYHGFPVELK